MRRAAFAAVAVAVTFAGFGTALISGSSASSQAGEADLLSQSWTKMQTASLYATYKKQNKNEAARLEAYWATGGTVPAVATAFGQALLLEAQAYWSLSTPPTTTTTTTTTTTPPQTETSPPPPSSGFPDATNTGVPTGVTLHACSGTISTSGTYDLCSFSGGVTVNASNVKITRSKINGYVNAGDGRQTGLVISDSEIDCHCQSNGSNGTPPAIGDSNYTLLRVNLHNSGHGASVKDNVVIQDSWIHGLGGTNDAHKDGLYSGDGHGVKILHNNIECDAGDGCTAAIGILTDFSTIYDWTIDSNLLNTSTGSYCLYGSGGPQKPYGSHDIRVTNNTFGQKYHSGCGFYGPVTYYDVTKPGMVWSNNKFENGTTVLPAY